MLKAPRAVTTKVMALRSAFARLGAAPARAPSPARSRRAPVDWRRYATQVHRARRRLPRYEHPVLISVALSIVLTLGGVFMLQALGVRLGSGIQNLGTELVAAIPKPQDAQLVLGETQVSVSAAPVLDGLPDYTKANDLTIAGKVPSFAVKPGRQIAISVNGKQVGTYALAVDGRFGGAPITLPDGANTITATLVEGVTEVASSSHTVVVKRAPPLLSITRPKTADTVDGPDVIVEGKTEPAADVTVNDRALRPNPDGTFTERVTASPGPLALTIVARDKAGNETKTQLSITVKQPSQTVAAGTALSVVLDRAKVKPGETVVARVLATEDAKPKADLAVTLQVGVITIGTYRTDATGGVTVAFAAPNHEADDVAIVVLGGGAAARATLTVSTK